MIEFIIYDESKENKIIIEDIIDKEMINENIDYKKEYFHEFSKTLREKISNETFKIYILNQTNISKSGLEIAKYIREKQDDWKSIIIFISKTNEYKINIFTKRLFILDYILIDSLKNELNQLIKISLKNYYTKPKELKYKYKSNNYSIPFKDIIYIEKEQDSKRCIIKTTEGDFYIQGNLSCVEKLLDKRFLKCCRSVIVNLEQVLYYNKKTNIITFKNKMELDAVSRDNKKELINHVRGIT